MLHKVKTLIGYKLHGCDGEFGRIKEFYFDDHHWTIRYLVADTGNWLTERQVLISPYAMFSVNKEKEYIEIDLTKKQIEESPSIDSDKPVFRQFEEVYNRYYGWPTYWEGPHMWGADPYIERDREKWKGSSLEKKAWDPNLRSTHEVNGYDIQASDGELGHVEDFIIDDETWAIRYLIIDTVNWWPGKKILISPHWVDHVSWRKSEVFIDLQRETIKCAPEYTDEFLLTRDYESGLYKHYNREGY